MTTLTSPTLREVVDLIANQQKEISAHNGGLGRETLHYGGMYDFVAQHGVEYQIGATVLPPGTPRACFGNSALVMAGHGLRYVEGFAASAFSPGLPVHHAWNLDEDGLVVDTTWTDATAIVGHAYLGVEFPFETVRAAVFAPKGTGSVLDDWKRSFPIFRTAWKGAT